MSSEQEVKHSPEPFRIGYGGTQSDDYFTIVDRDGQAVADFSVANHNRAISNDRMRGNAARIVACVNACAGIADPAALVAAARAIVADDDQRAADGLVGRWPWAVELLRTALGPTRATVSAPPAPAVQEQGDVVERADEPLNDLYRHDDLCRRNGNSMAVVSAETLAAAVAKIASLSAELKQLREVVEKLPKTADGVPIVPGMDVYQQYVPGGPVGTFRIGRIGDRPGHNWCELSQSSRPFYSTKAAALAAHSTPAQDGAKDAEGHK